MFYLKERKKLLVIEVVKVPNRLKRMSQAKALIPL